jgi:hypothetical protein|eukprot:Transcript_20395.p1 GENE.Transcript_20395~~Transcript_20395.p1  ORF type:complete len:256 (+),score=87.88 Transcript_20395:50-817(+)
MPDKAHDALIKEAEKLAKKGETKQAIKALQTALEAHKVAPTMLRIAELQLHLFTNEPRTEHLHQAAELCVRVLRSQPSAEQMAQAEALLKRAGPPARKHAEEQLSASTRRGLQQAAGAGTTGAQIDNLLQSKGAAAAAPPPQQPPPSKPPANAAGAAALADDLFGCRLLAGPSAAAAPPAAPVFALPPPPQPAPSTQLALPAPGGAAAQAEPLKQEVYASMRRICATVDEMTAANRTAELQWVVDVLQRLEGHLK